MHGTRREQVLNTLSFVLMLLALNLGKVTYVGALRQLSLVVGVGLVYTRVQARGARQARTEPSGAKQS